MAKRAGGNSEPVTQYIVKRVLFSLVVLWIISIVVFSALRAMPGDVCHIVLQTPDVDPKQCASINAELGLDKPFLTQYMSYMGGVLTGDFGKSLITRRDVWGELKQRIPLTVELTLLATTLGLVIAVPIGVISAIRQDRIADHGLRFVTIAWLSIPGFWLGTMFVVFPAKWWGYSSPIGYVDIWKDPAKNLGAVNELQVQD